MRAIFLYYFLLNFNYGIHIEQQEVFNSKP